MFFFECFICSLIITTSCRDFYVWQSDSYGNCFTFNSPNLYKRTSDGGFVRDAFMRNTTKSGYQVRILFAGNFI